MPSTRPLQSAGIQSTSGPAGTFHIEVHPDLLDVRCWGKCTIDA
jgi:hypothetical protein